jgi:hypothetical protein
MLEIKNRKDNTHLPWFIEIIIFAKALDRILGLSADNNGG